jgi:hypothetical protein
VDHLAEVVGEDSNGVESVGLGQLGDQVDTDRLPRGVGYGQWLSGGTGVQVVLPFRADFTSLDILLDERSGLWPPEGAVQELICPVLSGVSSRWVVVALLQYVSAQLQVRWDIEVSPVEDKAVVLGPFRETVGEAFGPCLLEVG